MAELAVTDTHALIWFATGVSRRLGRGALRHCERADEGRATVFVPTLCLVEIAESIRLGRLGPDASFLSWEAALFDSGSFVAVDLTRDVIRIAEALYGIPERTDRLIAATAVHLDAPLITRDPEIVASTGIETIW